jgi:hypothetical protein
MLTPFVKMGKLRLSGEVTRQVFLSLYPCPRCLQSLLCTDLASRRALCYGQNRKNAGKGSQQHS